MLSKSKTILKLANLFKKATETELLKRFSPKEISSDEKLLLKYNIIPIITLRRNPIPYAVTGEEMETSLLGAGASSRVYEVMYKGKLVVAKITDNPNDILFLDKFSKIKSSFGEGREHLPEVYDIIQDVKGWIAVVEKLKPINIHLKTLLYQKYATPANRKSFLTYLKDNGTISSIVDKIFEKFDWFFDNSILKKVKNIIVLTFRQENFDKHSQDDYQKFFSFFESFFIDLKINIVYFIKQDTKLNLDEDEVDEFAEKIIDELKKVILTLINNSSNVFPTHQTFDSPNLTLTKALPETRSLVKALLKLEKKYGISWGDLHDQNIMERIDGTLVISDPGLFYQKPNLD